MSRASTPEQRSRRRKAIVVIVIGILLLIGWVAVVAALTGQSPSGGDGGQGSGEGPSQRQAGTPEKTTDSAASTPEEPVVQEATGNGSSSGTSEAELEDVADEALSPPPGGGPPPGEVPIEDEEGRSNGQRGFVSTFIGAAYGYTGKDADEYRAGYENRIDTGAYYDSAGGKVLEEYAAMVEDGGAKNAAVLKDYRITSGEPVETQVNAKEIERFAPPQVMKRKIPVGATVSEVTYAVGDRYGDPGEDEDFGDVYGEVDYLKQRLFISREEGGWKIVAASAPEPTEKPKTLDPDAPKVGYEPEGGHEHGHGPEHGAS